MTKTRPLRMTDDTYKRLRVATAQAGVTTGTLIGMALDALERENAKPTNNAPKNQCLRCGYEYGSSACLASHNVGMGMGGNHGGASGTFG